MAKILVIAEHDGQALSPSTAKTVACGTSIDGAAVDVLVLAANAGPVAAAAAALASVNRVLTLENGANANAIAAVQAPQIAAVAAGYSHIFGPSTTFGRDLMPRVAALLGVNQISDIMSVDGPYAFRRPIYAGNAVVAVEAPSDQVVVATVRAASYQGVGGGGSATVESLAVEVALPDHTRYIGLESGESDRPDLQTAARVIAGGRALGSADNFDLIYRMADKLGAGVGATRAAVDAGYIANDAQVGQTGKIIAPELYFAIGISGAIQHVTGIKDAGTIVAINKDGEAPIFEVADIGLVGDLFQIVPELTEAL